MNKSISSGQIGTRILPPPPPPIASRSAMYEKDLEFFSNKIFLKYILELYQIV